MSNIFAVIVVGALAVFVSSSFQPFGEIREKTRQVELRIERMKANPSPIYEHYPNPERSESPGIMEDGDQE